MPDAAHLPSLPDDGSDQAEGEFEDDQSTLFDEGSDEEIEEFSPEDFATYYVEREGRLFPSDPNCAYPLPFDANELQRLRSIHDIVYQLLGNAHYLGPVPEVLAPIPGADHKKRALDLCTGTGKWAMDVARSFPQVLFSGVDIVPICTRFPRRNVRFEMQNVSGRLRWRDGTFDLIHARDISMAIRDWPSLIDECARLLSPGGLFISCEWLHSASFDPNSNKDPNTHAPASVIFFDSLRNALLARQVQPIAHGMHDLLIQSGRFTNVNEEVRIAPVGDFGIGRAQKTIFVRFANSVMPVLTESGMNAIQAGQIVANYLAELENVDGFICPYYITYARRV